MQKQNNNQIVCFFNSTKAWGGGEKWHFDVASRLSADGWSIIVAAHSKGALLQKAVLAELSNCAISVSNLSFLNPIKILMLYRFFKKSKIDTVILCLPADVKTAGIAARLACVTNIVYRRGSAIPVKNSFLNRWLFKKILTHIIANSQETRRTINRNNPNLFPDKKITVIYNGIDLQEYDLREAPAIITRVNNEIILGNAGRLVKQKAQYMLIEIAAKLKQRELKFRIYIAGDGLLKDELEKYAIQLGVKDEVVFLGFVKNIKSFMSCIDIFLLSSLWEGFGYVIAEAMVCSKPTIAFDLSSNPELIENNKTGYLISPYDIDAFSERIIELSKSNGSLKSMGNASREKVYNEFSIERTIAEVKLFLNSQCS